MVGYNFDNRWYEGSPLLYYSMPSPPFQYFNRFNIHSNNPNPIIQKHDELRAESPHSIKVHTTIVFQ